MKYSGRRVVLFIAFLTLAALPVFSSGTQQSDKQGFPDFFTSNEDYYVTRIGSVPNIEEENYTLKVFGLVEQPGEFTLDELRQLNPVELPLTVECIGNAPEGPLLSTAVWKGFSLYDFLLSLGIAPDATGVRYRADDGYYASHTLDQIKDNGVLGALFMNGEVIPQLHGFPLRILNPGYYGVKQPAWVIEIEVIDMPIKDYWEDRGWDCSPPMAIDSTIFYPKDGSKISIAETVEIGGAAFGGTRVSKVEYSTNGGDDWKEAEITERVDADNVWVFWKAEVAFPDTGKYAVNVRATDINGNVQPDDDPNKYDGSNDWPILAVDVRE